MGMKNNSKDGPTEDDYDQFLKIMRAGTELFHFIILLVSRFFLLVPLKKIVAETSLSDEEESEENMFENSSKIFALQILPS